MKTGICHGCNNPSDRCTEKKYCDICLHHVLDHFETIGYDWVTEGGTRRVFNQTFVLMVKFDVLERSGFYERETKIAIPECVEQGSLKDAIAMIKFDATFQFLMGKRVHNVQRHLYRLGQH